MKTEKELPIEYTQKVEKRTWSGNETYKEWTRNNAESIIKKRIERSINARKRNIDESIIHEIYYNVSVIQTRKPNTWDNVFYTRLYVGRDYRGTKKMISSKANESINLKLAVQEILNAATHDANYSKVQNQEWDNCKENDKTIEKLNKKFSLDFMSPISLYATNEKDKIEIKYKKDGDVKFIEELIEKLKKI